MAKQSHIEQMIQNLCPAGVDTMTLGEIEDDGIVTLGRGNVISKDTIAANPGDYPVYSSSSQGNGEMGRYGLYMFTDKRISWSIDGGGKFFFRDDPYYSVTNVCGWLKVNKEEILDVKYLYYVLYEQWIHKLFDYTLKAHPSVIRELYIIPMPPIKVQKAIVRILDTFADLIDNIDAEIDARKAQLETALNRYFEADVKKVPISELGKITRGKRFVRTDIVEQGTPCIHYGDIYTRYPVCVDMALTYLTGEITKKMRYVKSGDVVYVGAGENDEDIGMAIAWLGKEPAAVHDACYILSEHEQDAKYLAYMSRANDFHQQLKMSVASGKICSIPPDGLGRVKIPVPPIAEQRAIAEKLDTIEAFINNLKTERDLRQQQYEYYREHLINLLK
ncbi:MAG: restriction endonuclease subunit S [Paludibacteraceae bacterium]|nr:restriction endonuclease subunit S [Paludibacteraceae bacterium]